MTADTLATLAVVLILAALIVLTLDLVLEKE
jgi:hypothetical protein